MSGYNYTSFSPENYDLQSSDGPEIGQKAPNFTLKTLDGQDHKLLDFKGECLVLELGSMTCPLFLTRNETMQKIAHDYQNVSHAVLYVREAHPGETIPAHKTMEDKQARASLLKSEFNDHRVILVDDVEGAAHQAYGSMPNAVYIIDKEGTVKFKASWNNGTTTRKALEAVLAGKQANFKNYFKPAKPAIVVRTARRAGKGSGQDFAVGLPKLIWNVLIKNNIRTFFQKT